MFDVRLAKGVVFRLDADAAKDHGIDEGTEFAISKDATSVEVRGSKFKDGKPSKGRPRKFSVTEVARMLGITDLPTVETTTEVEVDTDVEDEAHVEELVADTVASVDTDESGDVW